MSRLYTLCQDFSDFAEEPECIIQTNPDGSQCVQYAGMEVDLPPGSWQVKKDSSGDWVVFNDTRRKMVKNLVNLKRARKLLGQI